MFELMGKKPVVLIVFLLFFGLPQDIFAGEVTLEPFVNMREEYDDNILFSRTRRMDDLKVRVNPGLDLSYRTEVYSLTTNLAADLIRYIENTEFNANDYNLQVSGDYKINTLTTFSGSLVYEKDSTQESQLEETGLLNFISERKRTSFGAGLSRQLSELSEAGFNFSHSLTEYDFVGNTDYTYDRFVLSYSRRLHTMKDLLSVQPYYGRVKSDVSQVDNYGLSFGWSHDFTEKFNLTAYAGARYTETEYHFLRSRIVFDITNPPTFLSLITENIQQEKASWGGVADVSLTFSGETTSTRVGYTRDLSYSASGDPVEKDRLLASLSRTLTRRLSAQLSADITRTTQSRNNSSDDDIIQGNVRPSITYRLTERHLLRLAYTFSRYYKQNLKTNKSWDRNRIWLLLSFRFPQKYSPNAI